jgi:uncharacterized DUF497 family protein/uncharacterized protein (DUF4415 family)
MSIRFTWDPTKERANILKHGVTFADAARIFEGATLERPDNRFDYGERRIYAIGLLGLLEITVVYVDRDDGNCHIIPPGGLPRMNDDVSGNISMTEPATDPDMPPTDAAFWQGARVVMPRNKETITIRLDGDLLAWLRQERGYQTRINAVLRAYMESGTRDE